MKAYDSQNNLQEQLCIHRNVFFKLSCVIPTSVTKYFKNVVCPFIENIFHVAVIKWWMLYGALQ